MATPLSPIKGGLNTYVHPSINITIKLDCSYCHYVVPSGFPQSFMESVQSSRSVTFSWMPPLPDQQNGVLTGYTLNITEAGSGVTTQRTLPSSQTTITVTSLLPFTTYSFAISSYTSVGPGPFSTLLAVTTPEDGKKYITCTLRLVKSL